MTNRVRRTALTGALLIIAIAILALQSAQVKNMARRAPETIAPAQRPAVAEKASQFELAKEITSPDGFINTDGITIKDLVGSRVILVDFWTYSCINCQRTIPYLNRWHELYGDKGLTIIGVHTPEFGFEQEYNNVRAAVEKFGIRYPVVLDNDYSTWHAYRNRYWPHKYLIDIDGFIVYDHVGEGAYEETEAKIQELLAERAMAIGEAPVVVTPPRPASTELAGQLTPEIYFGAARNSLLGNGRPLQRGQQVFTEPADLTLDYVYLSGQWNITDEYASNRTAPAKILLRYRAQDVHLVASADVPLSVIVRRDGQPLGAVMGSDVSSQAGESTLTISEDRLYTIVSDPAGSGEHTLELIIPASGLRAFTFTFG